MSSSEAAHRANLEGAQRAISSKQEAQLAVLREIMDLLKEQNRLLQQIVDELVGASLDRGGG